TTTARSCGEMNIASAVPSIPATTASTTTAPLTWTERRSEARRSSRITPVPTTPTALVQPAAIRTTWTCAFTKVRLPAIAEASDDPDMHRRRRITRLVFVAISGPDCYRHPRGVTRDAAIAVRVSAPTLRRLSTRLDGISLIA